jgi:phosphatidylserine/phosphatidylglycerophosphate/cardiolipin synthase-like enzyme
MTTQINSISVKTRQRLTSLLCVSVLLGITWWQSVSAEPQPAEILAIYFTPPAGSAGGLIKHIDASKKTIKVMAYGFTATPLSEALVKAHRRGVKVRSDGKHAIQHNKVMLLDDDIVITGSYNFTKSAEVRNAENIIILKSAYAAKRYADNWVAHWGHGEEVSEKPSKKQR